VIRTELKGGAELRRKLMAMEKGLAADFLHPIVDAGAQDLRAAEASLAPRGKTGDLAAGIQVEHIKAGKGYAYALIGPDKEQYYGQFQEYGLGTGRSTPVSERVRRRRSNYEASLVTRKQMIVEQGLSGPAWVAAISKLGKKEAKRQKYLAEGRYLQGERRPNMAAHPFIRPAVTWRWPYIRQMITERLRALVERFQAAA
jgi:HK97 gp10 family phage protein